MSVCRFFRLSLFVVLMTLVSIPMAGHEARADISVQDLCGRSVTLSAPAKRIVVTFNIEEVLAILGPKAEERIVGWGHIYWKGRRQWIWQKYTEALPWLVERPDVGYVEKKTLSAEKIVALRPDLVIMVAGFEVLAAAEVEQLQHAGIPVAFVDYHTDTVATHQASTRLLGKLLGEEVRAERLAQLYAEETAKVTERLKALKGPRPRVYLELGQKGPGEYDNAYGPHMWGALIDTARGDSITRDVVKTYGPVSPELVLSRRPEVIIVTGSYWANQPDSLRLGYFQNAENARARLHAYEGRQGWKDLPAIQNGRLYGIHHGLSRHIYDFVALQAIAKMLYPEVFADLDPEAALAAFHRDWLPVTFSGVWTAGLDD
ncbi:ABC transporter substrate-binding protein [Shumkonia mesophila]|uniref:ABC transporter substrate-binding protein n=1 Tax=Shumkonia mesophila TaxID=2838854 RepID=UPI002934D609|nr:ABC transporter substrate-binding protein [Shumkonia mesophila]